MKKQRQEKTEDKKPSREAVSHKRRHIPWYQIAGIVSVGIAVLAGLWLIAGLATTRFVIGNTSILSLSSDSTIAQKITEATAGYKLGIAYPDGSTKTFSWTESSMHVDTQATTKALRLAQHTWSHLLHWWQPVTTPVRVTAKANALDAFISKNVSIVIAPAQDAQLNIVDGTAQITTASPGKQYSLDHAKQTILASAGKLQTKPLLLQIVVLPPSQDDASLASAKSQLTAILNQRITINIGSQAVNPSNKDVGNWITITQTTNGPTFGVDAAKVSTYLAQVASSHGQSPKSQIVLDSSGQIVQAGAQGMRVSTSQAATDTLTGSVLAAKGAQVTLPVQYTAFQTIHTPSTGKWLEINLSSKRMYAYEQGELVRTFLVSAGAAGTPTVTGRFAIFAKYPSQTMTGPNLDGTTYVQPDVPWVNYFYGSYAIHGNYWRPSSYFGNVNSSHGCVGVPVSDGAWIYSWAPIGTAVIVHY